MDEKQIIRLCRNGHTGYYENLINQYEESLYRYCFHLCCNRDDASDLFQDTWVKAISKITTYDETRSFKNWLFAIATNHFRDKYRKKIRRADKTMVFKDTTAKDAALGSLESKENPADEELIAMEAREALKTEVNLLKPHYRMVIILHYYEELPLKEVGRVLGVPEGTVKSRLNQARKILKERMGIKQ